jgi:hypothetical protein
MTDTPGADERRREQERIRREYPDLYYVVVRVAVVVLVAGFGFLLISDHLEYRTNLFTEGVSILTTVLIIDFLAKRREQERYKRDLLYRMGSEVNNEALRAVDELRRNKWLQSDLLNGISLVRADLSGAPLWHANLVEADLMDATLINATLIGAKLTRATLWGADFRGAQLSGAHLNEVNRSGISMKGRKDNWILLADAPWKAFVPLHDMNFEGAFLMNANLEGADLSQAVFRRANLLGASLIGADIEDANFEGATLPNGDIWHPGYDMSIFTNPPDSDASDG